MSQPSDQKKTMLRLPLAKLTEETIKVRTKSGDTPLHRAAKNGKIHEIPRHLLQAEFFLAKNHSGKTPLHIAAEHGCLNQIPSEFLTKKMLTDPITWHNAPNGVYTTGSGYVARTETILHVAVRCGHAEQIPKEFLTPECLSIEASGYRTTVLHDLAYRKCLDLVPDIYVNSKMWNLKDSSGQTPRDVLEGVIEQERLRVEREAWRPPRQTLPIQTKPSRLLPVFSDKALWAIQIKSSDGSKAYVVNLLEYTCTCPLCLEIHSGVPLRDFGRLCKHIVLALREQKLVTQLPPIARGIVENGLPYDAFGIYPGRFEEDLYGRPIYITGQNYDGWISVFALLRRNGVNYARFGYNVKSRSWYFKNLSYVYLPKIDESILY